MFQSVINSPLQKALGKGVGAQVLKSRQAETHCLLWASYGTRKRKVLGRYKSEHTIIEVFNFRENLEVSNFALTYTDPVSIEMWFIQFETPLTMVRLLLSFPPSWQGQVDHWGSCPYWKNSVHI